MLLLAELAWFGGYRTAEGLDLPSIGLGLQPSHPTSQFLPSGLTTRSLGHWGNRAALQDDNDVIVIGDAPHDWLFPKMAAVVHHAGAGTTAAGLRAGVPTVSVPMITDQPFWASRVTALGAGPKAVPYKSLSADSLAAAIRDAVSRDSYRSRAEEIAKQLATEDGALPVIRALDRLPA